MSAKTDANGNMTVLTNPVGVDHGFGYNKVNNKSSYTTPLSGSYSYVYDKDRRLIQKNFPSGRSIENVYDTTQLIQIRTPEGNIDFTYYCGDKVESITKGAESISYTYDGSLLTSDSLTGTLNQSITFSYNNDFLPVSTSYAGGTEAYQYDNDGLLVKSGDYTITRNADNGLPETVRATGLNLNRQFNAYGELDEETVEIGGANVGSWNIGSRDATGRILSKTETVGGVTSSFVYTYDAMGRLVSVTKDGDRVEEYQYDVNGTRIYERNELRGITGMVYEYSDEDHLLSAGDATYQYTLDDFYPERQSVPK